MLSGKNLNATGKSVVYGNMCWATARRKVSCRPEMISGLPTAKLLSWFAEPFHSLSPPFWIL